MDAKLSKEQFSQLIEQAYPTYVITLNQKCFTRCVRFDSTKVEVKSLKDTVMESIDDLK